jgi:hypothetical protein
VLLLTDDDVVIIVSAIRKQKRERGNGMGECMMVRDGGEMN